jgi:adenylate cyclase
MEAPPLERKLVAILAADVASYSRTMEIDEEGTLATLSAFRLVTDRLISQHEGRICGTAGDSILAAFGSALAAVQCAVEIQNELAHSNNELDKDRRMQFRIGINVGDVMLKDGDIFGDGVNIAARLEGLADPGGICISRGIHDHVMKKLPFEFDDLGEQSVKNIAQPVRVYRLLLDERASESRSSTTATPSPGVEADVPSLSEDSLLRRPPARRRWKSNSGTQSRTAFSPASTKPILSNILRAASSRSPAFVSKRSSKTRSACAIRMTVR